MPQFSLTQPDPTRPVDGPDPCLTLIVCVNFAAGQVRSNYSVQLSEKRSISFRTVYIETLRQCLRFV